MFGTQQRTYSHTHGHNESVLRAHTWRSASNSAAYLLPHLKPYMTILDVGCGPGTITTDLAAYVSEGNVIGMDSAQEPIVQAREHAEQRKVTNVEFIVGDGNKIDFPDGTFDVVHEHAMLQHVSDPVGVLKEMKRVTKKGGIIAAREADQGGFIWYPEVKGLREWHTAYLAIARAGGGEPNAGRRLHAWAAQAGIPRESIERSAGTWCYSSVEERVWWGNHWRDRIISSRYGTSAKEILGTTDEELKEWSDAWEKWGMEEDGWFGLLHGEIICHV